MNLLDECGCPLEGLLTRPFADLPFAEQQVIVSNGKPTPDLTGSMMKKVRDGKREYTRRFQMEWYTTIIWLCGCKKTKKIYCWPCVLFNDEINVWSKHGVDDMNAFRILKKRHEMAAEHVAASYLLFKFGKSNIEFNLTKTCKENVDKYNENVNKNRHVLSRIIDAICYIGSQELAFRGDNQRDAGNYTELLNMLAQHDVKFSHHLQTSPVFSGTSKDIQSGLISAISDVLMDEIRSEIRNKSSFFAIIMDESRDTSNRAQLSTVVRYVLQEDGQVRERFLTFHDVSRNPSTGKLENMLEFVEGFYAEEKLVAQTNDGAPVMASLQTTIKQKYEEAIFVHCYAHSISLVLQKSVDHIRECKKFFQTLSGIASFFSKSSKRSNSLDSLIQRRLPTAAAISWEHNNTLVKEVCSVKNELVEVFANMMDNLEEWDGETRACARGFHQNLKEFDFNFLLHTFSLIFLQSDILFDMLQKRIFDVKFCTKKIKEFVDFLRELRLKFDDIWNETNSGKYKSKIDFEFASKNITFSTSINRGAKRLRISDTSNARQTYRQLFYKIIDTFKQHTVTRFSDIEKLKFLALLNCKQYDKYREHFPEPTFKSLLRGVYRDQFDFHKLKAELIVVYTSEEFSNLTISQLARYLHLYGVNSIMPEVSKLASLMLTILGTSASGECTSSTLKSIRTYLKGAHDEEMLNALALISIEKKLLRKLKLEPNFYSRVIDKFAQKCTHIELHYK